MAEDHYGNAFLVERRMSEASKLGGAEKSLVRLLGFCDPAFKPMCDSTGDGAVSFSEQSPSYYELDGYAEAFKNLAGLGGSADSIDAADIKILGDPASLAKVISQDPVMKILYTRRAALEAGKIEIPRPAGGKPVPPRHYRRFVAYLQMALKKAVDPSMKVNGLYDEKTRKAIDLFQKGAGILLPDGSEPKGRICGPKTIGPLVMRLRYSRAQLVRMLEADKAALALKGIFFMGDAKADVHVAAQGHVVEAFKWLGYIDESVDTETREGRMKAIEALQERFKVPGDPVGPNMVGPKIIGKIIERVSAMPF